MKKLYIIKFFFYLKDCEYMYIAEDGRRKQTRQIYYL